MQRRWSCQPRTASRIQPWRCPSCRRQCQLLRDQSSGKERHAGSRMPHRRARGSGLVGLGARATPGKVRREKRLHSKTFVTPVVTSYLVRTRCATHRSHKARDHFDTSLRHTYSVCEGHYTVCRPRSRTLHVPPTSTARARSHASMPGPATRPSPSAASTGSAPIEAGGASSRV